MWDPQAQNTLLSSPRCAITSKPLNLSEREKYLPDKNVIRTEKTCNVPSLQQCKHSFP